MALKDLFVTPIVILVLVGIGYAIRPLVSSPATRIYFFPAFLAKVIGAIALGAIYQFYYGGGDTLNYYFHGTTPIWEAFLDRPYKAIQLIFANGIHQHDTLAYSSRIWFFSDLPSYFVIRVGALFSLITGNTYSAMAVLFAAFSFSGAWAMYQALLKFYPQLHRPLALAIFFIPSVVFWGSGMMKDTLTLGALGWLTWAMVSIFFERRRIILSVLIILLGSYLLYSIKIYIILCFAPAAMLWVGIEQYTKIRQPVLRALLLPIFIGVIAGVSYIAIQRIGQDNARYSIDSLSRAAEVTARWINYVSEVEGGAGYTLGDFDYSPAGIARKFFPAIFVTLFQPFLWQASNPVMLISALESFLLFALTLYILFRARGGHFRKLLSNNSLFLFSFIFSMAFAAAVG
ncbi:MAG: hypothetical protein AAFQ98_09625, partial [Bacteroidota bacterium]